MWRWAVEKTSGLDSSSTGFSVQGEVSGECMSEIEKSTRSRGVEERLTKMGLGEFSLFLEASAPSENDVLSALRVPWDSNAGVGPVDFLEAHDSTSVVDWIGVSPIGGNFGKWRWNE